MRKDEGAYRLCGLIAKLGNFVVGSCWEGLRGSYREVRDLPRSYSMLGRGPDWLCRVRGRESLDLAVGK